MVMMLIRRLVWLMAFALPACGGAAAPPATALDTTASLEPGPLAPGSIRRSSVHAVISAGLGAFLQRIEFEDTPAMVRGKFHGFRIHELKGNFWDGVDLKPGDVITKVNGQSIEHPGDALEVFRSLELAGELVVDYEREGKPRQLHYAIVDDGRRPSDTASQ
jgi:S1-C subfamily serine protease